MCGYQKKNDEIFHCLCQPQIVFTLKRKLYSSVGKKQIFWFEKRFFFCLNDVTDVCFTDVFAFNKSLFKLYLCFPINCFIFECASVLKKCFNTDVVKLNSEYAYVLFTIVWRTPIKNEKLACIWTLQWNEKYRQVRDSLDVTQFINEKLTSSLLLITIRTVQYLNKL